MEDHNCNLECSLSNKGISTPKKCSYCNKMMFFKTYRCKHCRYKCHKKCASNSSSRRNSCQKTAGDEHWTKVLQANEVNSNVVAIPCHSKHALQHVCQCDRKKRKSRRSSLAKSDKSLNSKDTNIFTSLYARFVDWVAKTRNESQGHRDRTSSVTSSYLSRSRSSSKASLDLYGYDILSLNATSPEELHKCYHTSVSSEDSEYSAFMLTYNSSNCSSLTLTSNSTSASDFPHSCNDNYVLQNSCTSSQGSYYGYYHLFQSQESEFVASEEDYCPASLPSQQQPQSGGGAIARQRLTSTTSFQPMRSGGPGASWLPGGEVPEVVNPLCATWPPSGKKHYQLGNVEGPGGLEEEQEDPLELEESVFGDYEEERCESMSSSELREALGECSIAYSDLDLGECVRVGRRHKIYKGRWHGDVMIHTYQDLTEEQMTGFLGEVSRMSILRHENIALFMGACLEQPNLAVVTSDLKGTCLYQQIHLQNDRITMHSRVTIARQVAQGMGYLHAKGIVLKRLNSKNVYLDPKVKICLIDYGMAEKKFDRPDYGCVSRGTLCYVAPELLRSLHILGPKIEPSAPCSKATDVFAFGTLLYELLSGTFPMLNTPPECLLWQVACGKRQHLHHLYCNVTLKTLIQRCWGHLSEDRPTFYDINTQLQENTSLHKRHSTSNPERLHRVGSSSKSPF